MHFDTKPCSPVPISNSCEDLCLLEYCLQIIDFKFHCTFSTNCFSKHSKTMQVFMFFSTILWVFLPSHMFFLFFFFCSEKRKREEECEARWCSLVCWMCLADVKPCCVFWFWVIISGTLVLAQDLCHCKKKAHDPLSWTEFPAFTISVSFEAAIKPGTLYLILQTLVLEICYDDTEIAIIF